MLLNALIGRRRKLPDLRKGDNQARSAAERQAVSTRVQGSAADIMKSAMVAIWRRLRSDDRFGQIDPQEVRPSQGRTRHEQGARLAKICTTRLVLHLHDELIYEVPEKLYPEMAKILKDCMENAHRGWHLPVKMKVGKRWGEMNPYDVGGS